MTCKIHHKTLFKKKKLEGILTDLNWWLGMIMLVLTSQYYRCVNQIVTQRLLFQLPCDLHVAKLQRDFSDVDLAIIICNVLSHSSSNSHSQLLSLFQPQTSSFSLPTSNLKLHFSQAFITLYYLHPVSSNVWNYLFSFSFIWFLFNLFLFGY